MDCKEMILSEDTYDIITDFSASEFLGDDNNCYERIGEDFLILYLGNLGIRNPKIDFFPYHNMPKLYGLMQLSPSGETPPGAAGKSDCQWDHSGTASAPKSHGAGRDPVFY